MLGRSRATRPAASGSRIILPFGQSDWPRIAACGCPGLVSGGRPFGSAAQGRNRMKKALLLLAAAGVGAGRRSGLAPKKQLVIVVKGLDNPFFEAIHQGCEKWNKENAELGLSLLLHRPGIDLRRSRRSADRAGHAEQARHGGDGDLAVERAADRQTHQDRQPDDPDHDGRRRPHQGRRGACARPISAPTTT